MRGVIFFHYVDNAHIVKVAKTGFSKRKTPFPLLRASFSVNLEWKFAFLDFHKNKHFSPPPKRLTVLRALVMLKEVIVEHFPDSLQLIDLN